MSVADDGDGHLFSALSSQSPFFFFVVGLYILSNPDPDLRKRVKLKLVPISTPDASAVLLFRGRSCVRLRVREIKNKVKRVWGGGGWGVISSRLYRSYSYSTDEGGGGGAVGASPIKQKH